MLCQAKGRRTGNVKNSLTPIFAIMGAKRRALGGRSITGIGYNSIDIQTEWNFEEAPFSQKELEELLPGINQHIHFSVRVTMRLRDVSCPPFRRYKSQIVSNGPQQTVLWVKFKVRGIKSFRLSYDQKDHPEKTRAIEFGLQTRKHIVGEKRFVPENKVTDEEMHLLNVWINQWEVEEEEPSLHRSPTHRSARARRKDSESLAVFLQPLLNEAKQANIHQRGTEQVIAYELNIHRGDRANRSVGSAV
jgi:hypothetical protein